MSGTFSSRTYNFYTLLGRSSFPDYTAKKVIVPPFQRGYSWEKSHVATFWEDVFEFHTRPDPNETYFMGPVVILPQKENIIVLDGQQRLATATILLSVIRDMARQRGGQKGSDLARDIQRDLIFVDEDEDIYALELSELDKQFFKDYVQKDPPVDDIKPTLRSHRLITQARSFLLEVVTKNYDGKVGVELTNALKSLRTTVAERIKLVVIDVASEEEAYQIFETLNDRGLRLSVPDLLLNFLMRSSNSDSKRESVRGFWNNILETLGTRRVSTFLRHMWVSHYGDVKSQSLYREIRSHVTSNAISSVDFARKSAEECENYNSLIRVDGEILKSATPHVEAIVRTFSVDKAYPLLLSGLQCLDESDFEKLSRYIVALIVRHSIIANLNPSDLEDTLYKTSRLIHTLKEKDESSSAILFQARKMLKEIYPERSQLNDGIEDVYLTKPQGGYILGKIEDVLQSDRGAVHVNKASIEHVFPEKAKPSEWPNKEKLEPFIWHIGNLFLLEPKLNRDAGNKGFKEKKEIYGKSDFKMAEQILDIKSWNEDEIIKRSKRMVKHIDTIWNIP